MIHQRDIDRQQAQIRKITVGIDPKNGLAYELNGLANKEKYTITHLGVSEYDNAVFNKTVYHVFIKVNGRKSDKEHIWKAFDNVPCSVEFVIPNED